MKKLTLPVILSFIMCISVFSQEVDLEEEQSAGDVVVLKKDSMPVTVKQAVLKDFEQGLPIQWAEFPYLFKEYGWLVSKEKDEGGDTPGQYYVVLNAKGGSELDAIYAENGKLIRSREILKNFALPKAIEEAIFHSEYKDWKISADKELVIDYYGKTVKHYTVKVEKDKKKKYLYFDENGNMLHNKKKKV